MTKIQQIGEPARSRILFLLTGDTYVRNYADTGILFELSKLYDLQVFCSEAVTKLQELSDAGFPPKLLRIDPKREKLHNLLNEVLMWRYRARSRTFSYRWMRLANWDLLPREGSISKTVAKRFRWLLSFIANWRALRIILLGNRFVFPVAEAAFTSILKSGSGLQEILSSSKPDLVVFPSSAFESVGTDIIIESYRAGIKTFALIDNWDNLSSKTIFWTKPNYISVWGPQTAQQAETIQGFEASQVFKIGTPRFENYFNQTSVDDQNSSEASYILFVGSAMAFDELSALQSLEAVLDEFGPNFSSLQVIYRPHPWQQKRRTPATFNPSDFRRTTLDPQLATFQSNHSPKEAFQPSLDYYPGLLRGAELVLGPLTTMLFEAALCGRKVVALAYDDGHHFTTSRRYFSHFDGMETVPGFRFCENSELLKERIWVALTEILEEPQKPRRELNYFITTRPGSYIDRLKLVLGAILNG